MTPPQAVIFDLGGTLIDWPDWVEDVGRRWSMAYDYLVGQLPDHHWPERTTYVEAMLAGRASPLGARGERAMERPTLRCHSRGHAPPGTPSR